MFEFGEELGQGAFAKVVKVTNKKTNQTYAMKVIDKTKNKGIEQHILREIKILKNVKHPNVIYFQ